MGIESAQIVYDYLSRVGDLAQQELPADQRLRLVEQLRVDIDRQRSGKPDSPAAVRRILGRMGSPDTVVERAASGTHGPAAEVPGARPAPGTAGVADGSRKGNGNRGGDGDGNGEPPSAASVPSQRDGRRRGEDGETEWWRLQAPASQSQSRSGSRSRSRQGGGGTGGLDGLIPREFQFTPGQAFFEDHDEDEDDPAGAGEQAADGADEDGAGPATRAFRRRWWSRPAPAATAPEPAAGPVPVEVPARRRGLLGRRPAPGSTGRGIALGWRELAAVALLVGGTLMGSWVAVLGGWVLAYYSRRLGPTEARIAAIGVPAVALAGLTAWLWGRANGRWGEPLADGRLGPAIQEGFPVAVRIAALGSAVFVVWRSDRRSRS